MKDECVNEREETPKDETKHSRKFLETALKEKRGGKKVGKKKKMAKR